MDEVVYMMSQEMTRICSGNVPVKDLIITKSIGDVASYKIRALDNDDKKCQKRLESLDLYDEESDLDVVRKILNEFIAKEDVKEYEYTNPLEYKIVMEYISKALPGQVQLAQKVRARGGRVEVGERMGFIVIESKEGLKAKVSQKLEDPEYYKEHAGSLRIDPLYYVKKTIKQFDEVLDAVYKVKDTFKNCYKYRENHHKMIQELNSIFSPKIVLVD
jgi:DNA polymerase elongation subunit (family B)